MLKLTIASTVASALAYVGYFGVPAALLEGRITPESAQAECSRNPDEFFARVRQQAESDLEAMMETRSSLRASSADVENRQLETQEKLNYATNAAEEFRSAWQCEEFPVMIRGRAYTRADVEAHTSSLLAQIDGYSAALAQYTQTITDIREHVEDLTVQIVRTETDLGLLDSKCSVYKATHSETAAAELMASVDSLFRENATVISASPVRSVEEMIRDTTTPRPVSHSRAVTFLAGEH